MNEKMSRRDFVAFGTAALSMVGVGVVFARIPPDPISLGPDFVGNVTTVDEAGGLVRFSISPNGSSPKDRTQQIIDDVNIIAESCGGDLIEQTHSSADAITFDVAENRTECVFLAANVVPTQIVGSR